MIEAPAYIAQCFAKRCVELYAMLTVPTRYDALPIVQRVCDPDNRVCQGMQPFGNLRPG